MIIFNQFKAMSMFLIFLTISRAENYTVSLYFEQTEEALTTLIKTQVFPHPIGDHNGDGYDIYLWEPNIDIEPNSASFQCTIYADVTVSGNLQHYTYTFDIPLNIPSGELSISGIISILEGIPDQITSMEGPQWVKDIIIAEYEGLELTVYPNSLLEDANASIPGYIDVEVTDISYSWEAMTDLIRYTISVDIDANTPWITGEWQEDGSYYLFHFNSNIETQVLFIGVYTLLGESESNNPELVLNPDEEWSDSISIYWANTIPSGHYRCKVLFGSTYGWFAVYYSFNNASQSGWNDMFITDSI